MVTGGGYEVASGTYNSNHVRDLAEMTEANRGTDNEDSLDHA